MGSEMCIRDSGKDDQFAFRNSHSFGDRGFFAFALQADEAQLWPCLLYTSDAADERSSVDLGGRRIIKKKNRI